MAILKYPLGCDPDITSEIVYDEPINEHLGCVDVIGWRDFLSCRFITTDRILTLGSTLTMQSKTATELFAEFDKAIKECFTVPNHCCLKNFRINVQTVYR